MNVKGVVFNIQRYTVHDGPGIRTELFLKGCPLKCRWCSNPEGLNKRPEPGVYTSKCIGKEKCGRCAGACPVSECLRFTGGRLSSIDRELCTGCMKCASICPADAVKAWGGEMTVGEVMDVIRRDTEYYRKSGGGVTISGGDPLVQSDFVAEIFKRCKEENIHTCLESTFYAQWSAIEKVLPYADMLITDIKHMDSGEHKRNTGVPNELILKNLARLSKTGKPIVVRVPVIPGVNDDMGNISATADFILNKLGNRIQKLQLLGFMRLGEEKYASLGEDYPMKNTDFDRDEFNEHLKKLAEYFKSEGIDCITNNR